MEKNQADLYPQEMIMKMQIDRQAGPLQEQKIILEDMKKIEFGMINKIVIVESFNSNSAEHSD